MFIWKTGVQKLHTGAFLSAVDDYAVGGNLSVNWSHNCSLSLCNRMTENSTVAL